MKIKPQVTNWDVQFLILLNLKLFHLVTISWWWVFAPAIVGVVLAMIALLCEKK